MKTEFYDPETKLETERLLLRKLELSDAKDFYNKLYTEKVTEYYLMEGISSEDDEKISAIINGFSERKQYAFAITDKKTGEFMGIIHQCSGMNKYFRNVEVGYALGSDFKNKGYMTEAMSAFIELLFSKGVHKVFATHLKENSASGRVMQKCGMKFEGEREEEVFYKGKYHNILQYSIINTASQA